MLRASAGHGPLRPGRNRRLLNNAASPYCPFGFTGVPSLMCPVGVAGANRSWVCCVPFVDLPNLGLPACTVPSLYEGTPNDACASGTSNCETGSSCPGTEVPVISSVCLEEGANGGGSIESITDCCVPPLSVDPCASGGQGTCGGSPGVPTNQEGCPSSYTLVPSATCDQCCLPLSDLPSVGLGSGSGSSGSTSSGTSSSSSGTSSSSSGGSSSGASGCSAPEPYIGSVIFEEIDQVGSSLPGVYSVEPIFDTTTCSTTGTACEPGVGGNVCCYQGPAGASDGGDSDGGKKAPANSNAGTVTIEDNGAVIGTTSWDPTFGYYDNLSSTPPPEGVPEPVLYDANLAWNPGDVLSVSAVGYSPGVGPFSGSVLVPAALAGLNPSPSASNTVSISVSSPLVVTWTPQPTGTVAVILSATLSGGGTGTIRCGAQYDAGTLTVPLANNAGAPILSNFTAGEPGDIEIIPSEINAWTGTNATGSVSVIVESAAGLATYTP